jgi:predicted RNA-binding protein YlxR (DUF448 family)
LFRIVRLVDGQIRADRNGPGRGAWLCRESSDCWQEAIRRRGFERAFKASVDSNAVEDLRASLERASKQAAIDVRG